MLREIGKNIKTFKSNKGTKFCNKKFQSFLDENNIKHELTCVYTLEQNKITKKDNHMIIESAKKWYMEAMSIPIFGERQPTL